MGYNTSYILTWKRYGVNADLPNCEHMPAKGAKFCPKCGVAVGFRDLNARVAKFIEDRQEEMEGIQPDGSGSDSCKWYEHEERMKTMSKQFWNVLFTLSGEGENSDDIWNKYFLNGKMQVAKAEIRFPAFDPKKFI